MTGDRQTAGTVGTRTIRGMAWAFGSYAGGRILILVATALLARILTPEDFGLVALALTFTALLDGVANLGLGQALIIRADDELATHAETAFRWSIVFGASMTLLVAAASPGIAAFFDEPELVGIVSALGVNFFLRSLGITHYSLAQRDMNFRARTAAELADAIVRGVVGIGLALAGFGAWSLVIAYLVGTIALDVAIWRLVSWRPTRRGKRAGLRSMLRFGGTLSAVDVVAAVCGNIDNIFIGRILGPSALGLYSIAFTVPLLAIVNVSSAAERVLFPAFAIKGRAQMRDAFLTTTRYLWLFALPAGAGLAILAEPLILTVFGDQWTGAIDAMRFLAVYGFALATSFAAGVTYKAMGRPGVILAIVTLRLAVLTVSLALFTDLGITAVAACQAAATGLVELGAIGLASRLLKVRLGELARQVLPAVLATLAMAVPLVATIALIETPWVASICGLVTGAATYASVVWLLAPDTVRYLVERMRGPAAAARAAEL